MSVVLTAKDYGRFLPECLDSLLAQTAPVQEYVLVDDGSTDDTPAVLDRYEARLRADARVVRLTHGRPRGLAAALNRGFAEVTQPLAVHVDADDTVEPRFVEALRQALDAEPTAHYAYPRMRLVGDESGIYLTHPFDGDRLLFEGNYIPNVAMMRTASLRRTSGFRDLPTHLDWDLWLSFLELGMQGVLVDEVLYNWRRHGGAMTVRPASQRLQTRLRILWHHRGLALRRVSAAPRWTASALARRRGARRSGRLTASAWTE